MAKEQKPGRSRDRRAFNDRPPTDVTEEVLRQYLLKSMKDGELLDKNTFVEQKVSELFGYKEALEENQTDEQILAARETAGRVFDEISAQDKHLKDVRAKLEDHKISLEVIKAAKEIDETAVDYVNNVGSEFDILEEKIKQMREFSPEAHLDCMQKLQDLRAKLADALERVRKETASAALIVPPASESAPTSSVAERPSEPQEPSQPPAEQPAAREVERPRERQELKNIDLPSALLAEILEGRESELRHFMELMYRRAVTEEHGERVKIYLSDALQELFAKEPDEKIMGELKKHGIENWHDFLALLKGDIGDNVNSVMNKMVQEQIQRDAAKNIKWYEQLWAIKGQMSARILTNITLVGGGVALASFVATGIGGAALGIGAVAVGGGTGGFIRGLLQKFVFGTEKKKEKMKEKLQALAKEKQTELAERLLKENFSEASFAERTNKEVAEIFTQVLREASSADVSGEPRGAANLDANAKRQYLDALRALKEAGGVEPEDRQKIELVNVLYALQAKSEQKQAEALKHSDPAVVRVLDGVMRGYTGAHEKAGIVSTAAIGAAVGVAFAASNNWARGIMGGIGGALTGYQAAEKLRARKEEDSALKQINTELEDALMELELLKEETEPELQKNFFENLNFYVYKFRSAMRGGGEELYASALKNNPILRARVENLIYESDKAGAVVEAEQRKKISSLLEALEKEGESVAKEAEKKSKVKNWFKKTAGRVAGFSIGAAVGAAAAIIVGEGIKEWRHILFDYHAPGAEPPQFETKPSSAAESLAPEPEPAKPASVPAAKQASPTVAVAAAVAAVESAPAPSHTGDFDFANAANDKSFVAFADEQRLARAEFDYLKSLAERFPELNKSETFGKILDAAEYRSGKHSAFPDVYKGTINTPIEAAADSRFATFDAILKAGGAKRAAEFLKLQDFNEHDLSENLKFSGSLSGSELENKFEELVKAYQGGDNKAGKRIFDAFRHDQNRVIAQYEDARGIVHIKGVGGRDPRVLGGDDFHNNKLMVAQARGYGKVSVGELPQEKPKFEFITSSEQRTAVKASPDLEEVLKTKAKGLAHYQETIKQESDGHVIEYHVDSKGQVIGYDNTADLLITAVGPEAAGFETGVVSEVAAVVTAPDATQVFAARAVPISGLWHQSGSGSAGSSQGGGSPESTREVVSAKAGEGEGVLVKTDTKLDEERIDFKTTDELEEIQKGKITQGEPEKQGDTAEKDDTAVGQGEETEMGVLSETTSFEEFERAISDNNWNSADQNQAKTCLRMLQMQDGLIRNHASNLRELFTENSIADGETKAEAGWRDKVVGLLTQKQDDSLRVLRRGLNQSKSWKDIKTELAGEMFLYDVALQQPTSSAIKYNDESVLLYNRAVVQKLQTWYDTSNVDTEIAKEAVGLGGGGTASE